MKILLYCAPILIIVFVVVLYTSGSLSGLMSNSVSSLYCDEGYILSGSNCTKTITTTAYLLGDINKDNLIDVSDIIAMQRIANDFTSIDDEQKALADVNEDGKVDITDLTVMQLYLAAKMNNKRNNGTSGTGSSGYEAFKIGKTKICPSGYNFNSNKTICSKIDTVSAIEK